jgi:two-component system CheB/CheR fusion protein
MSGASATEIQEPAMASKKKASGSQSGKKPKAGRPPAGAPPTPVKSPPAAADEAVETKPEPSGPPVAGIGASAGGLDAFKKFFTAMPADSGIAFVLIPHLDPRHESLMVELISRHTPMPVAEAEDGTQVQANHVYIIPPNKYMTITGGILRLSGPIERGGPQTSIDLFLRSLGDDKQEQAICVILSGTGAHGTLGLKAVKAAGGLAMVQDPETADYPAMPQSAIATDLADYVLPVEKMPPALVAYVEHYYANGGKAAGERKEAADELNQVLALVRARNKLDFRHYRRKMLARRVERRLSLCHFDRVADYVTFLRDHPDEVRHLSRDLLISVTSFFRDPEAWRTLETQVIAPLVRAKEPDEPLRVWCAGCATGEEAYSLGILLLEQLASAQKNCPVQIFATDVDDESLDVARRAVYPESIVADVSPVRLARFFTRVSESSYQVSKQLRETAIFARQDLISDAPFSKMDLVVCRNLLIYLEQEVQKKIIALLHFALSDRGALFLASSESIGRSADLFEPLSAKWRIYRRIGPSRVNNVQFPVAQVEPRQPKAAPALGKPPAPPRLPELAQSFLLRRFALACVVINRNYQVLHFAGPTEDYLIQPGGPPTHDLLSLARPGLESKLRVVLQRAIRENSAQRINDVMMRHGNISRRVNIDVEPLNVSKQTEGLLLIAFQEQPPAAGETLAETRTRTQTAESDLMRQLEQELETTREDLQSTIEELESSNEELKASNEEIMSMNEELQSANEELETSKEELQSLNEELSTVNNQFQDKVQDLETANNDITNLFNCTDIATVFLDTAFRIRRFTPASTRLFKVIATDVGRPIGDIVKRFTDDDLLRDAQEVLRDLASREKEVLTEEGRWCERRIIPYRTLDDQIDGVVVTFVDITERKLTADEMLHNREQRLRAILSTAVDAIITIDQRGTIQSVNPAAEQAFGYAAA